MHWRASRTAPLVGWVNNAAVFRDAAIHDTPVADVMKLISTNLGLAVAGSAAAVRRFLADGTAGAIVNGSSHQAQRAVHHGGVERVRGGQPLTRNGARG